MAKDVWIVGGSGSGKGNLIGVTGSIENVHIYSF